MTTFSTGLTNHMVLLPQSRDSSYHVLEAKCPLQPTHLPLLQRVDSTDDLAPQKGPGRPPTHILATDESFSKNTGTSNASTAKTH